MPAYNFKKRFARAVETGYKRQTIRPRRKRPMRIGETLRLYTGMRGANCRLLCEAVCVEVSPVEITRFLISVDGRILNVMERRAFAHADGFATAREFFDFFVETYGLCDEKPLLEMELIRWEVKTENQ